MDQLSKFRYVPPPNGRPWDPERSSRQSTNSPSQEQASSSTPKELTPKGEDTSDPTLRGTSVDSLSRRAEELHGQGGLGGGVNELGEVYVRGHPNGKFFVSYSCLGLSTTLADIHPFFSLFLCRLIKSVPSSTPLRTASSTSSSCPALEPVKISSIASNLSLLDCRLPRSAPYWVRSSMGLLSSTRKGSFIGISRMRTFVCLFLLSFPFLLFSIRSSPGPVSPHTLSYFHPSTSGHPRRLRPRPTHRLWLCRPLEKGESL
jgi:hypothetical protein